MENPATWGKAEKIVNEAICKHHELLAKHYCGLSEVRMITDALRAAGMLINEGCQHQFIECEHQWKYVWHDAGGWYACKSCRLTVSDSKTFQSIKDSLELPLFNIKPKILDRKCQKCEHRERITT